MVESNEVSSLASFMNMIGGPEEYQAAVMVAAFVNLFRDSLDVKYVCYKNRFTVLIFRKDDHVDEIRLTFRNTYKNLFEVGNEKGENDT